MPQLVGQVESTSTMVKPLPSIWYLKGLLDGLLGLDDVAVTSWTDTPGNVGRAVQVASISHMLDGVAAQSRASRP